MFTVDIVATSHELGVPVNRSIGGTAFRGASATFRWVAILLMGIDIIKKR
jgi:hypothetical protein